MELETHLFLVQRLSCVAADDVVAALQLSSELGRMLAALTRSPKEPETLTPETCNSRSETLPSGRKD